MNQITKAIRSTLALWILTAFLYPLFMLICGQIAFPFHANGSLITNNQGTVVGSALIGQPFAGDRYFWNRPSVIDYSTSPEVATTGVSGASNLAPSNPELLERIQGEVTRLKQADIQPTADLVYTSGSGLDPHITPESAQAQVSRIAAVRNVDTQQIQNLISRNTEGRFLGIFGEPGVNVLQLNLALDSL
ncbi:K(+)-transporting ATPase subunit C [Nodularia sphaerocarpa]|uniref:K(+)-transporting ATPase subunit C n=1 Tax=Nodularia sphaerocarpa TaxID=137816 RepID=UPI001EFB5C21|nr:K(+)-transporting ATPase subunit C [Nodularia sphaerocarpa]MDB9373876.1 K(+)-transporting ATPase subunit C [Nodularia sphaerocarpa CS-585]ULP72816.1 Potassium-transporting ATPase KdpC subunit [Nodularia sphaerocarpa UHCC 0038]